MVSSRLWREAPPALRFLSIDTHQHPEIAHAAGVQHVPHIELHAHGTIRVHAGERTVSSIIAFVGAALAPVAESAAAPAASPMAALAQKAGPRLSIVWFYAPWCGHCAAMEGAWTAATQHPDGAHAVWHSVDCDAHPEVAQAEGVRGFPTVRAYRLGKAVLEHDGDRTAPALVAFSNRAEQAA